MENPKADTRDELVQQKTKKDLQKNSVQTKRSAGREAACPKDTNTNQNKNAGGKKKSTTGRDVGEKSLQYACRAQQDTREVDKNNNERKQFKTLMCTFV